MRFLLAAAALILAVSCASPTATASPTPSASPPLSAAPLTVSDIVLAHDEPVLEGADLEPGDHYGATLPAAYFVADGVQHSIRVHTAAAAFDGTRLSVIIEALFNDAQGGVYSDLWLANAVP